jgi:hypothetical protein
MQPATFPQGPNNVAQSPRPFPKKVMRKPNAHGLAWQLVFERLRQKGYRNAKIARIHPCAYSLRIKPAFKWVGNAPIFPIFDEVCPPAVIPVAGAAITIA